MIDSSFTLKKTVLQAKQFRGSKNKKLLNNNFILC